jgi:hypothetical protein
VSEVNAPKCIAQLVGGPLDGREISIGLFHPKLAFTDLARSQTMMEEPDPPTTTTYSYRGKSTTLSDGTRVCRFQVDS